MKRLYLASKNEGKIEEYKKLLLDVNCQLLLQPESIEVEEDVLDGQISGSALTPSVVRKMSRSFAGMSVTDAAIEELLLWYYEVVDEVGQNIREHAQLGANPATFIDAIDKMKDLMMLGWMRRMLVKAGEDAEERGYKRIDVEQLIHLDPFE